jgi:LuxR family transcriptional regulator, maltose regulon positive regulatory protein
MGQDYLHELQGDPVAASLPPIALTKTVAPSVHRARVERDQILLRLTGAASRRLILLKAPAGYGKTTIGVNWAERLQKTGGLVAWLSLDDDDNEPSAFAYHITKAIQRAAPHLGRSGINLLAEAKLIAPRNVVSATINAIAENDEEFYLFLDDYHALSDDRSDELVAFLLRYAPSNFHLVLMSRTEPRFSLSRLRLEDEVAEFDISVLRFTLDEAITFLGADLSAKLAPDGIARLHAATEGWPAALQLAKITLSNSSNPSAAAQTFSGTSLKISAYLEDTLATQADEIVTFLLRTAILDRLNGPLCQAVTGMSRSRELLEALDREQLLLIKLDERGEWFRYHHLMGDFLLDRLSSRMRDEIPELHRRAHHWYASQLAWTRAVQHALAAEDLDRALAYVEQCAMSMVVTGDLLTLLAWERKLPAELMSGQLEVKLALAWGLILVTRFAEGDALLTQVEHATDEAESPELWWRSRATRGVFQCMIDDSKSARTSGLECQDKVAYDPFYRNALCNVLRFGYWKAGEFDAFYAVPKPDISDGEATYVLAEQYRLCLYGLVAWQRLRTGEALGCYSEARKLIEKYVGGKSAAAAIPAGLSAGVRYELGDISAAEILVLDELDLIESTVFHESFLPAQLVLVRAALARADRQRALKILERAERLAAGRGWFRVVSALLVVKIRIFLREGKVTEAAPALAQIEALKARYPASERCSWSDVALDHMVGQGLLAVSLGNAEAAVKLLSQAYKDLLCMENRLAALRVGVDLSQALVQVGQLTTSYDVLGQILGWAAESGAISFILEQPPTFRGMLSRAKQAGAFDACTATLTYASELLKRFDKAEKRDPRPQRGSGQHVSARERSILEFIAKGQSNKEIARNLGVTPETVKTHVKRVFVKLSAESRAQAVVRAQSLGLLRGTAID